MEVWRTVLNAKHRVKGTRYDPLLLRSIYGMRECIYICFFFFFGLNSVCTQNTKYTNTYKVSQEIEWMKWHIQKKKHQTQPFDISMRNKWVVLWEIIWVRTENSRLPIPKLRIYVYVMCRFIYKRENRTQKSYFIYMFHWLTHCICAYTTYVRLSYIPDFDNVALGMRRLHLSVCVFIYTMFE